MTYAEGGRDAILRCFFLISVCALAPVNRISRYNTPEEHHIEMRKSGDEDAH
jgi:hypothetical protein